MCPALLIRCLHLVTSLAGVGPKQDKLLCYLLGREQTRLVDLLLHLPASMIDAAHDRKPRRCCGSRGHAGSHRRPPSPDTAAVCATEQWRA
jgi:hypothetical protein